MSELNRAEIFIPPTKCLREMVSRVDGEDLLHASFCGYSEVVRSLLTDGAGVEVTCIVEKCSHITTLGTEEGKVTIIDNTFDTRG